MVIASTGTIVLIDAPTAAADQPTIGNGELEIRYTNTVQGDVPDQPNETMLIDIGY